MCGPVADTWPDGVRRHKLKCWPEFFRDVESGVKTFEVRKNDRDYRVGDLLELREWRPETESETGRVIVRGA